MPNCAFYGSDQAFPTTKQSEAASHTQMAQCFWMQNCILLPSQLPPINEHKYPNPPSVDVPGKTMHHPASMIADSYGSLDSLSFLPFPGHPQAAPERTRQAPKLLVRPGG